MNISPILKCFLILLIIINAQITYSQTEDEYEYLMLFSNILNHVKTNYIEELSSEELYKGAIVGLLNELDPHTQYLDVGAVYEFTQITAGERVGVGIEFEIIDQKPMVVSVIKGSPADKKNIKTGDVLVEIDSQKIHDKVSHTDLLLMLYGEEGTKVELKFKRNNRPYHVKIKRNRIDINSISLFSRIAPDIGYIKCIHFSETTAEEMQRAVKKLRRQGAKKLIIDLRDNPGGVFQSVIDIADLFLPEGKKIVSTTGRKEVIIKEYHTEDNIYFDIPLILIINRGTASASEVFAGCLQDHDRALLIGTNSFGKGLIQKSFLLKNGAALLMTIGEYRTPLNRKVQRSYKNKTFQEYYHEIFHYDSLAFSNKTVFKTAKGREIYGGGGIYPNIFIERNAMIDSLEYSIDFNRFIIENAVRKVRDLNVEAQYKEYAVFKNDFTFSIDSLAIIPMRKKEHDNDLRILIKAEIAGLIWGLEAKFDIQKEIDGQLRKAIASFSRINVMLNRTD